VSMVSFWRCYSAASRKIAGFIHSFVPGAVAGMGG
jgi:hypothetical protein